MSSFTARLHLPGQTKLPLSVEVDVVDERIVLSSGQRQVADWALAEIEVADERDGFHLKVDHEEIVLNADDAAGLARILGVSRDRQHRAASSKQTQPESKSLDPEAMAEVRYDELKGRIADVRALLTSRSVAPSDVFAKWLRLLKEINRRHGQGSLPTRKFYELNTELLDLIPEPPRSDQSVD